MNNDNNILRIEERLEFLSNFLINQKESETSKSEEEIKNLSDDITIKLAKINKGFIDINQAIAINKPDTSIKLLQKEIHNLTSVIKKNDSLFMKSSDLFVENSERFMEVGDDYAHSLQTNLSQIKKVVDAIPKKIPRPVKIHFEKGTAMEMGKMALWITLIGFMILIFAHYFKLYTDNPYLEYKQAVELIQERYPKLDEVINVTLEEVRFNQKK